MSIATILVDVREHWLLYASMPIIAAAIGYGTKLLAVEMMFEPIEFRGRRPYLGWQGIIPRMAGRMASIACDTLTEKLLDPKELFDRIEPERVVKELEQPQSSPWSKPSARSPTRSRRGPSRRFGARFRSWRRTASSSRYAGKRLGWCPR